MRTIRLLATLRDIVGAKSITIPFENGSTARDLIRVIQTSYPELGYKILDQDGHLTGLVHIFVNGRNIQWLDGLDTTIGEADELYLVPPVGGG